MFSIPGKIPVTINPFFWVLAFLIGWLNTQTMPGTLIWIGIILVSVLIHELGHALTAMSYGQSVKIELTGFGGLTTRRGGGRLSFLKEFIIVLNGPLAGFALAIVAWIFQKKLVVTHPESTITYVAVVTFYVNVFWTIVNLLPIQPLDGGKLLGIFLEYLLGLRGKKITLFISFAFALLAGIGFFAVRAYLAGALFLMFAFEGFRSWKSSLVVTEQDDNFILQHLYKEAERDMDQGAKEAAISKFQRIREMAQAGVLYIASTERVALLLAEKGELKEAHDLLKSLGKKITSGGVNLLHQLAYRTGDFKEAIVLGKRAYHDHPDSNIALLNAMSHSLLGEVKPAVGWLQCAIKEGIPNLQQVLASKEFDTIRHDPLFRSLYRT